MDNPDSEDDAALLQTQAQIVPDLKQTQLPQDRISQKGEAKKVPSTREQGKRELAPKPSDREPDEKVATTVIMKIDPSALGRLRMKMPKVGLSDVASEIQSYSKQRTVFISVSAVLGATIMAPVMAMFVFFKQWGKSLLQSAFFLAFLSCIFFGVDNFIVAYSSSYIKDSTSHMGMVFVFEGVLALALHAILWTSTSTYKSEWHETVSSSWRALGFTLLTGGFIASGHLCGNIGFNADQAESGPHQALICSDVLMVSPFFYWYAGETLTKLQVAGCAVVLLGMVIMSDFLHWTDNMGSLYGFSWIILSTLFYASSIVTWRLVSTGREELPWQPRVVIIFGSMGLVGFVAFLANISGGAFDPYLQVPALLVWPLLNCLASFLGMWFVNLAYEDPEQPVGAITAVVDSNSVVLLVLNLVILQMVPAAIKTIGMCVILFGCLTVSCGDNIWTWYQTVFEPEQRDVFKAGTLGDKLDGKQETVSIHN